IEAQRQLAERIQRHWLEGSGRRRIPDRAEAMDRVRVVPALEDAYAALGGREALEVWTTAASARGGLVETFAAAPARLEAAGRRAPGSRGRRGRCSCSSVRAGASRARWSRRRTCGWSRSGRAPRRATTT